MAGKATRRLQRYSRCARLFHAGVYLSTLVLLFTGLWLLAGEEGDPSFLSRTLGLADTSLHVWVGRGLVVLAFVPLVVGRRGIAWFARETFRRDKVDGMWWARWPAAVFTGRFARHEGHFDPGQRVANVLIVSGLGALVLSGLGMTIVHGGPVFVWLSRIHRWTTYLVTPLLLGHIVIALGVLPGYRGSWRSMHMRGKVPEETALRLWPGWAERELADSGTESPSFSDSRASH